MGEVVVTPHPTDPFCFTWSVGTQLLGDAVLAPEKQALSVTSPCCWAKVTAWAQGKAFHSVSCDACKQRWEGVDVDWTPATSGFGESPSEWLTHEKTDQWLRQVGEVFYGPLEGAVIGSSLRDSLAASVATMAEWTDYFIAAHKREIYDPQKGPLTYDEGERFYRIRWRMMLPELQDLLHG